MSEGVIEIGDRDLLFALTRTQFIFPVSIRQKGS